MSISVSDVVNAGDRVEVTITSPVRLTGGKKNPMANRVTKRSIIVGKRLKKGEYIKVVEAVDPDYQVKERRWGEWSSDGNFISHKDNLYVELQVDDVKSSPEYFLDGEPIKKEDIEGLPKPRESTTPVTIRTVNIENIDSIVSLAKGE